jgi:hypothetical protein
VVTNGAIPAAGCTDLGAATNIVISGATVSYFAQPTVAYTVSVSTAASRYCYALEVKSTNSYTLAAGLTLMGSHTITGTNIFTLVPHTGTLWRVYARGL